MIYDENDKAYTQNIRHMISFEKISTSTTEFEENSREVMARIMTHPIAICVFRKRRKFVKLKINRGKYLLIRIALGRWDRRYLGKFASLRSKFRKMFEQRRTFQSIIQIILIYRVCIWGISSNFKFVSKQKRRSISQWNLIT